MPTLFSAKPNKTAPSQLPGESSAATLDNAERDVIAGKAIDEDKIHSLPGHNHNPLSAFNFCPDKVEFVNEDPEEKVILLMRRHPITNVKWILLLFPLIILPAFATALLPFEQLPLRFQIAIIAFWYLFVFGFALQKFLEWFFNVDIVSDERIIDVNFVNLVYREVTDANIDEIQEVTVEMGGPTRTFFNFGDVIVQTAAEIPRIDFEAVPQPDRVAKILRELRIQEEQEKLEGRVR
jgi:membrane protein YdbS with pleckstrin-like domain